MIQKKKEKKDKVLPNSLADHIHRRKGKDLKN